MRRDAGENIGLGESAGQVPGRGADNGSAGDQRTTAIAEARALTDGRGRTDGCVEDEGLQTAVHMGGTALGQCDRLHVQPLQFPGHVSRVLER